MRVFLHDLPWQQDAAGFKKRINTFFADCGEAPYQRPLFCAVLIRAGIRSRDFGKQHAPRPGVHNSGWVQSPGSEGAAGPGAVSAARSVREGRRGRRFAQR